MSRPYALQSREQREVNTDPQRRCYWGAHAKSEWQWSEWVTLYSLKTPEEAEEAKTGWQELAKSSGRRLEYRVVEDNK